MRSSLVTNVLVSSAESARFECIMLTTRTSSIQQQKYFRQKIYFRPTDSTLAIQNHRKQEIFWVWPNSRNFCIRKFSSVLILPFGKVPKMFYGVWLKLRNHARKVSRQVLQCYTLYVMVKSMCTAITHVRICAYTNCSQLKKFCAFKFHCLSNHRQLFNSENFPMYRIAFKIREKSW